MALAVVLSADPEEPLAVAVVILALALGGGALAGLLQLAVRGDGDGRGRARRDARLVRRAAEVAAALALLLLLRVVDGLSLVTGGFVVAGFAVAELILSTRPNAPSR